MRDRPTLCAVVLTLDEAANIERCLASVAWCDDRVVVDSGSLDGTPEIARDAGARVFTNVQEGAFLISAQRTWALHHCEIVTDWVLFLDADEVIPPALERELRDVLPVTAADGLQLCQKYMLLGRWMKHSQRFPQWHDRVVRTSVGSFQGGVWEHFPPELAVARLQEPYIHYANGSGFSSWLARHDRYSTWEAAGVVDYLSGRGVQSFRTKRRVVVRSLAARLWPVRPVVRFVYTYFIHLGFLEGVPGLLLSLRYAFYEYMIVEKVVEARRRQRGKPL